ncbi:c-type cytochrome [Microvirga rosea]|nr:c-type cytochrome [Microvirga rosea]
MYAAPALPQLSRRTALWKSLGLGALAAILIAGGYLGVYYQSLQDRRDHAERLVGGRAHQGQIAIARYGCSGCHTIPGISRADGLVGPPLTSLPRRVYIAGVLKNSPDNLVRWIVDPRQINPQTAMPRTGISQAEARDVVAYLYTID